MQQEKNFTVTLLVDQSPADVFKAVINPRAWWSEEIRGGTAKAGDVFDYHFEDIHRTTIKLTEVRQDTRVVWLVLDNYFKPGLFDEHPGTNETEKAEWVDTRIIFDITKENGKTRVHFVHEGLVPDYICYDICVNGWTHYIKESLYHLITTGTGQPNKTGRPMTTEEKKIKTATTNA